MGIIRGYYVELLSQKSFQVLSRRGQRSPSRNLKPESFPKSTAGWHNVRRSVRNGRGVRVVLFGVVSVGRAHGVEPPWHRSSAPPSGLGRSHRGPTGWSWWGEVGKLGKVHPSAAEANLCGRKSLMAVLQWQVDRRAFHRLPPRDPT